jgi:hypothetical protein
MQLKKTVRKAKNVSCDMIIGIDEFRKDTGKTRVWKKVKKVVKRKQVIKGKPVTSVYLAVNKNCGLQFISLLSDDIVPVKVHPNTKLHKAKK